MSLGIQFYGSLNQAAETITTLREEKGFVTNRKNILEKLMLVVTEVAEAAEAVRHDNWEGFEEELADVIIRVLDITGALSIDIEHAIIEKHHVNMERPHMHGKNS